MSPPASQTSQALVQPPVPLSNVARVGSAGRVRTSLGAVRTSSCGSLSRCAEVGNACTPSRGSTDKAQLPPSRRLDTVPRPLSRNSPGPIRSLSSKDDIIRLLLVRHAQSANKALKPGQKASANPALTDVGYDQSEALGARLSSELGRHTNKADGGLLIVSSPMRRCLLTIQPTVQKLRLGPGAVLCHGSCFEFGCAGNAYAGCRFDSIADEFPEFSPVGFNQKGLWDYRGDSDKENEAEARLRGIRIVEWLRIDALALLEKLPREASTSTPPTIVLCSHQTISDLLCHIMVEGSADSWSYGEIKYPLRNASMTELLLQPSTGRATHGIPDDQRHSSSGLRASTWAPGRLRR